MVEDGAGHVGLFKRSRGARFLILFTKRKGEGFKHIMKIFPMVFG